jgi:ribosomal protein S18 acetylase RimI-like enzyme
MKIKIKNKGYIEYTYSKDHSFPRNVSIDWIKVKKKFRRQRVATKLITILIENLKKENVVWVSLWTGYEMEKNNAMMLFKNLGFIEGTYQEDYYEDGIGTRLFIKKLS